MSTVVSLLGNGFIDKDLATGCHDGEGQKINVTLVENKLTALWICMKIIVFLEVTPCRQVEAYRRFGGRNRRALRLYFHHEDGGSA
jgi:hypothetical protein